MEIFPIPKWFDCLIVFLGRSVANLVRYGTEKLITVSLNEVDTWKLLSLSNLTMLSTLSSRPGSHDIFEPNVWSRWKPTHVFLFCVFINTKMTCYNLLFHSWLENLTCRSKSFSIISAMYLSWRKMVGFWLSGYLVDFNRGRKRTKEIATKFRLTYHKLEYRSRLASQVLDSLVNFVFRYNHSIQSALTSNDLSQSITVYDQEMEMWKGLKVLCLVRW